jgi:hypothetical protein
MSSRKYRPKCDPTHICRKCITFTVGKKLDLKFGLLLYVGSFPKAA